MIGSPWRRVAAVAVIAMVATLFLTSPPAHSQRRKKATPTPTETPTPTPTPTPEVIMWNFDRDKPHTVAAGWKALLADWQVIPDQSAPSQPNAYGLPPGRLLSSLLYMMEYYPMTVVTDPREYSNFTLELMFKAGGGRLNCSGGVLFRYVDENNYYLLRAGCPSDFFGLVRVKDGQANVLKETVVPTDTGVWYKMRVVAQGGRFTCYSSDKLAFEVTDSKIAKGRVGLWAHADSQARFDNVTITLPLAGAPQGEPGAAPAEGAAPTDEGASGEAPPPMPGAGSLPPPPP